jgi:putative transposase
MSFKLKKQYRLPGYDYSQSGFYFITILAKNRIHFFGEIINNEIQYSPLGNYCKD